MNENLSYPIGDPNKKWDEKNKAEWLEKQIIKRSYQDEVLSKVDAFKTDV